MENLVPITRLGKFFGREDYALDIGMGEEWLIGDMNFTVILYRIDRYKTKTDDVYGEVLEDGIQFLEPGNMKFSIYQKTLEDLQVEIFQGDYFGYYESEDRVRYYVVSDDGYVRSDNKHTYGGYKPFYRTIVATYVSENEFRGI
jgi:antirestriction protein